MSAGHMRLWTVVPARGIATGKSRLAPVLSRERRSALNRELLERTLAVIGDWAGGLERCIVVSPCTSTVRLARAAGAATLLEGARPVGLNQAAGLGVAYAATHAASHVLILPVDLPYLGCGALSALEAAAQGGGRIVLAPDRAGKGTNALVIEAAARFEFSFGPASLGAHVRAAACAGLAVALVVRRELQFDLDTPRELSRWRRVRRVPGARLARRRRRACLPHAWAGASMRKGVNLREDERQ